MTCKFCGSYADDHKKNCESCGAAAREAFQPPPPPKKEAPAPAKKASSQSLLEQIAETTAGYEQTLERASELTEELQELFKKVTGGQRITAAQREALSGNVPIIQQQAELFEKPVFSSAALAAAKTEEERIGMQHVQVLNETLHTHYQIQLQLTKNLLLLNS